MSSIGTGSITHLIHRFKAGDKEAAQTLWERYVKRLVGLARKKLQGVPRRAADAEDVVQNAFASFWRRAEAGRFPQLHDRDSLWSLLALITVRKACRLRRTESRRPTVPAQDWLLEAVISREPTPAEGAQFADDV